MSDNFFLTVLSSSTRRILNILNWISNNFAFSFNFPYVFLFYFLRNSLNFIIQFFYYKATEFPYHFYFQKTFLILCYLKKFWFFIVVIPSHNYVFEDIPWSVCAGLCLLMEGFPYRFGDQWLYIFRRTTLKTILGVLYMWAGLGDGGFTME